MPLQKSFSETNHSSKQQRPQWNRNRSFGGPQTSRAGLLPKPLQDKPAIPVSTATKNKLTAFQFGGQPNTDSSASCAVTSLVSDDEKENSRVIGMEGKYGAPKLDLLDGDSHLGTKQEEILVNAKPSRQLDLTDVDGEPVIDMQKEVSKVCESIPSNLTKTYFPSTPAARLALPDLIGMEDVRRAVQDISPEDRLEWDQHSSNSSSFGIRRAKKRARSSSPISSPASLSHHNPQVDPGSELWGRYSLNGANAPTPREITVPSLAHLMQTSSPQPPKDGTTTRSVAGFRRTTSCGTQFPKRRRIGGPEDDDVFTESVSIGPSKLSVLIERVQEGFAQPKQAKAGSRPSVSSFSENSSQKSEIHGHSQQKRQATLPILSDQPCSQPEVTQTPVQNRINGSEYGDFDDNDLDDASLLEIFNVEQERSIINNSYSKLESPSEPNERHPSPQVQQPSAAKISTPTETKALKVEDDEFDDSDEDSFAAGLEDMVAKFNTKGSVWKTATVTKDTSASKPQKAMMIKSDSDDEFGDGGLDDLDFEVAEAAATQSLQEQTSSSLLPSTQKVRAIQRYLVTKVVESKYEAFNKSKQTQKVLILQNEDAKTIKTVHLRGTWLDTPVTVDAYVHVIGSFDIRGECIIDDANNILILHPDHLISTTSVGDAFSCSRRAVLQDRVKATSDSSAPLLYGTILHEIFQAALLANRWDTEYLTEEIKSIAARHVEDLYTIKLQLAQAVEYLQSKMSELQSWAELFVSSKPQPGAIVDAGMGETATMCVSKLLDVEEHVWSPMYGLKGNIDATVQITMNDRNQSRNLTVPFEVKTGKNPSDAHRTQTALYNLLISDRYDVAIAYGILYYMETSATIRIPTIRNHLRHMIMKRNELACFVRQRDAHLPPMLKKENMCNRCYAKVPCFIYHKLADEGTGETSGMKDKFDAIVKHLTPKHKDFFLKWDDLLTKEEKETLKYRRELWTMLSSKREKLGRCFSQVIIKPGSAHEEKTNPKINRYQYTLIKHSPPNNFSFLDSQIGVGEPIVISDEEGHFNLANGFVMQISKRQVTVAVDRRLHNARIRGPDFDEWNNQVFASVMEVASEGTTAEHSSVKVAEEPVRYRLDKDEFSNGMATVRNNLIQVMAEGPFGSREIRSLVVDLNAPRFKIQPTAYTLADRKTINVDQRRAIQKVMSAQDYTLVLGMPGTGKTTTIAHIIRALVSQGKSVLLTSYTHTAVDNILLKLKDDSIPILRLGSIARVNSNVQEFATLAATTKTSFEEIRSAWNDSPIVATTCLGINHALFNERTFDYCIVDEASQITLPVCIGPIRLARTFVLVGDHNQLPPVIQNKEAQAGGLDISLFKHLSDTHPSSVVYLEHQYRMCEDVMTLSNNLIYNGRLKCGNQDVANRQISIPDMDALKHHHYGPATVSRSANTLCLGPNRGQCWIRDLLDPGTKVAFINTDNLLPGFCEEDKGTHIVNPTEVKICVQLVQSLLSVGVPASDIGVITIYRSQLSHLKHGLRGHKEIEMHTTDRFQGRDKEVVILSLVRSNERRNIGDLLKDQRRINVAITRAKTKLLIIGSRETLKGNGPRADGSEEVVARLVGLMEDKRWIYDLPKDSLNIHDFEDEATQATASGVGGYVGTQQAKIDRTKRKLSENEEMLKEDEGWHSKEVKRKVLAEIETNGNRQRQPMKKIRGVKPFKIPQMSVLTDIVNDNLH